jgi:hypothetical protein
MPEMTKTKTLTKSLPHRLTDEEMLNKGQEIAREVVLLDITEMERADVLAGYKERLAEHHTKLSTLKNIVYSGSEYRDVECEERFYDSTGEVITIRMDSGEVIDTRPMTWAERQTRMDF